jgi:hypothetical protein
LSNSRVMLEGLVERCKESLERGRQGGLASLQAYRDAGAALGELKGVVPRGHFGPIADARCGCSKQWRARLMTLDREWPNVEAAIRWAEKSGRTLGRKAYSVDGALALVNEWRRAKAGGARLTQSSRTGKPRAASTLQEIAILKETVGAARAYIAGLEQELAAFRSVASNTPRQEIDGHTCDKIRKVAALWLRGGTDGERSSAVNQLWVIARRLGWNLRDLLRECAIESPAHFTVGTSG